MLKKEILFAAIFTSVGLISWFLLFGIFYGGQKHISNVLISAAVFVLFGSCFSLFSFLSKTKKISFISFALVSFLPLLIFGFNLYLALGLLVFFLCLLLGVWMMRAERDLFSLKLRPMLVLRKNLNVFFLALSLIISLVFYLSPSSVFRLEIPRSLFEGALEEFSPLISMQLPGFDPEMTVNDFFTAEILFYEIQPQVATSSGGSVFEIFQNPAFAEISKIAKNSNQKYLNNLLSKNRIILESNKNSFNQIFGEQTKGDEKIKDVMYNFINNRLLALSKPYQSYISLGFVFVVFLTLQALTLPFNLLAGFLSWIIFKLFLLLGIIKIKKEMVEKETVYI
jgi:hypothetical protein